MRARSTREIIASGPGAAEQALDENLVRVFQTQPICMKLLHLERRSADDEIIVSSGVVTAVFRRFVGRQPNYLPTGYDNLNAFEKYNERSNGVALMDVLEKAAGGKPATNHKYCFSAVSGLEWLCDFTSVIGREEAAEMAAQFVRYGLITLVSDKRRNNDSAIIFTVRGTPGGPNSSIAVRFLYYFLILFGSSRNSNMASSAAQTRPYTESPMKVEDWLVGITASTVVPRTVQQPLFLPLLVRRRILVASLRVR